MRGLYCKLAVSGIRKNGKLYIPYLISCVGSVMMFYIIHSLSYSPLLHDIRGGSNAEIVLSLGKFVIAAFALLFLLYTSSFVMRRRYKEFGLYNVLGMSKGNISRIVLIESLITAVIGLGGGILLGIVFSKFAELGLLRAIEEEVDYRFNVYPEAIGLTAALFAVIFALLAVKGLIGLGKADALSLLAAEKAGEKPPKGNVFIAILGLVILAAAYVLAVSIKTPLTALITFFIAVIMVILATYLLFIAGSVVLCRALQKDKRYYYKKNHFVSVASMVYRMKRNGAGLASICILSTMVLVMMASTTTLYFGKHDALAARFPHENELDVQFDTLVELTDENIAALRQRYDDAFIQCGTTPVNTVSYAYATISGIFDGDTLVYAPTEEAVADMGKLRTLIFLPAREFAYCTGTEVSLEGNDVLICPLACTYKEEMMRVGGTELHVTGTFENTGKMALGGTSILSYSSVTPTILVVVPSFDLLQPLGALKSEFGYSYLEARYCFAFDLDADDEKAADTMTAVRSVLDEVFPDGVSFRMSCLAMEKADFNVTYGGLFFLGIMLSLIFVFAAAVIIYYKQIAEGYEDQARFAIMRKVGMTQKDIKKSINSQILTVFFAPLIMAGVHLAFAFPCIWRILMLFGMTNIRYVILVALVTFALFGLVYAVIYKATARAYYRIVSE